MLGKGVTHGDGPAAPRGSRLQPPPGSAGDPGAPGGGTKWGGISTHPQSGESHGDWERYGGHPPLPLRVARPQGC